jgi:hypothetical protein
MLNTKPQGMRNCNPKAAERMLGQIYVHQSAWETPQSENSEDLLCSVRTSHMNNFTYLNKYFEYDKWSNITKKSMTTTI